MTDMPAVPTPAGPPQFLEPGDMERMTAEAFDTSPEKVAAALDAIGAAIKGATTPEEAAALGLAAAEQLDRHDYAPERDAEHDQAVPAAPPPMPEQAPPVPLFAGTYAIYDDGAGGVVLVVEQSTGEIVRKRIPAQMMKMAERFGGAGSAFGGIAGLFGGG